MCPSKGWPYTQNRHQEDFFHLYRYYIEIIEWSSKEPIAAGCRFHLQLILFDLTTFFEIANTGIATFGPGFVFSKYELTREIYNAVKSFYPPTAVNSYKDISTTADTIFFGAKNTSGFTCGVLTSGALKCWGENLNRQLVTGNYTASATPVFVDPGVVYKNIRTGFNSACGRISQI